MITMKLRSLFAVAALVALCGCEAVYSANRASTHKLQSEGTIVFTRPARFSPVFGSYSISELIEITYERVSRNAAGCLVVEAGIRYRGPVEWTNWYSTAPARITLRTVCNFFQGGGPETPIVYSTNQRNIVISRGETYAYKVICPKDSADRYQIILGD